MPSFFCPLLPTGLVGILVVSAGLDAGPGAGGGNLNTALMPDGTVWTAGATTGNGMGTAQTRLARVHVLAGANSIAAVAPIIVAAVGGQLFRLGQGTSGSRAIRRRSGPPVPTSLAGARPMCRSVAAGGSFTPCPPLLAALCMPVATTQPRCRGRISDVDEDDARGRERV